jgi:hypothetical protein
MPAIAVPAPGLVLGIGRTLDLAAVVAVLLLQAAVAKAIRTTKANGVLEHMYIIVQTVGVVFIVRAI